VNDFTCAIICPLSMPMDSLLRLSDEALVATIQTNLAAQGDRFDSLVETIVTSPQFQNKRIEAPQTQIASRKANQHVSIDQEIRASRFPPRSTPRSRLQVHCQSATSVIWYQSGRRKPPNGVAAAELQILQNHRGLAPRTWKKWPIYPLMRSMRSHEAPRAKIAKHRSKITM
jgi:Protein of unknown function (DUF1585)